MPLLGERDLAKEQRWRQIIADLRASGLRVNEFCSQNGIKPSQYYEWQRRIRERDAGCPGSSGQRKTARAKQIRKTVQREKSRGVEFAAVQIVDREPRKTERPSEESGTLEVVFPTGTKVRLSAGCSMDLFSSVVHILENR